MLGTDFPYRQFYPTKAKVVQVDRNPSALGRRVSLELGVVGDVAETLRALAPRLTAKRRPALCRGGSGSLRKGA